MAFNSRTVQILYWLQTVKQFTAVSTFFAGSCVTLVLCRRRDGHRKLVTRFGVIHTLVWTGGKKHPTIYTLVIFVLKLFIIMNYFYRFYQL